MYREKWHTKTGGYQSKQQHQKQHHTHTLFTLAIMANTALSLMTVVSMPCFARLFAKIYGERRLSRQAGRQAGDTHGRYVSKG